MEKIICSLCEKPASVNLQYAAKHLCSGCFVKYFEKRFLRTIREFSMIKPHEKIAVGLSGGKDSVVMLHLLAKLRRRLPFEIFAITIDEGIKNYRNTTIHIAKRECKKLGIALKVIIFKEDIGFNLDEIMKKTNSSACSWCGVFRRYLLNKYARIENANKIAIGHNLDDVAQTVLMNIMRNEPIRIARFLEPITNDEYFIPRVHPLLRTPEKEIAIYAMLKDIQIKYMECPYAHFSFRQHVKKQLNDSEEKYPSTKIRILNSFLEMKKHLRKWMKDEKFKLFHCKKCGESSSAQICMRCEMIMKLKNMA